MDILADLVDEDTNEQTHDDGQQSAEHGESGDFLKNHQFEISQVSLDSSFNCEQAAITISIFSGANSYASSQQLSQHSSSPHQLSQHSLSPHQLSQQKPSSQSSPPSQKSRSSQQSFYEQQLSESQLGLSESQLGLSDNSDKFTADDQFDDEVKKFISCDGFRFKIQHHIAILFEFHILNQECLSFLRTHIF